LIKNSHKAIFDEPKKTKEKEKKSVNKIEKPIKTTQVTYTTTTL